MDKYIYCWKFNCWMKDHVYSAWRKGDFVLDEVLGNSPRAIIDIKPSIYGIQMCQEID